MTSSVGINPGFLLSICIPTYNRAAHLRNCLSSLIQCGIADQQEIQVCISDNCSTDHTRLVIDDAARYLKIKHRKNSSNLGLARNIVEVVQMADGEFAWMLGDDDLLMPGAISRIVELLRSHDKVDYFYVNSNHLTTEYVHSFPQPFNLINLPKLMEPFSSHIKSEELPFLALIDPRVSFDFLGGIFLSVFRKSIWSANVGVLDMKALSDNRVYSHFDNTFPHIKIFAKAFANSKAYFSSEPASVCLTGAREWAPMSPLVMSIRLPEGIDEYRKNGLSLLSYIYCKNASLRTFFPDIVRLILNKEKSGYEYVNIPSILLNNCMYPNLYLSLVYPLFRKSLWKKLGANLSKIFLVNNKS